MALLSPLLTFIHPLENFEFSKGFRQPKHCQFYNYTYSQLFIFTRYFYTRLHFSSNRTYLLYLVHQGTISPIALMCRETTIHSNKETIHPLFTLQFLANRFISVTSKLQVQATDNKSTKKLISTFIRG
jgi:hypothetical protein